MLVNSSYPTGAKPSPSALDWLSSIQIQNSWVYQNMCHNFGTNTVIVTEAGEVIFGKLRNITSHFTQFNGVEPVFMGVEVVFFAWK